MNLLFSILFFIEISTVFAFDCSLPKDIGQSCAENQASRKFYYDSRTKVCQPLQYAGCGGNENRFDSSKECRDSCQNPTKKVSDSTANVETTNPNNPPFVPVGQSHDQWRKAEICGSNYLIPNGEYELCSTTQKCPKYHSCVNGACCPSKDYDGVEDKPRFAWNHDVHSCVRYSYYGMNGNYNNFPNFQSCIKYCKDSKKLDL
ncbi:unnamed protein product [Caenorhabditis angaria]|uniref:BPTI/Kunitz inhibitor domain-containing protein n=1 Tax=Caenorhabditis angaria TaxID=860376 RepID=A0A9P1IXB9_9PELO|nr:unnamed protein product [Caenorhabditis angaria]